jgi:hypothetical protein
VTIREPEELASLSSISGGTSVLERFQGSRRRSAKKKQWFFLGIGITAAFAVMVSAGILAFIFSETPRTQEARMAFQEIGIGMEALEAARILIDLLPDKPTEDAHAELSQVDVNFSDDPLRGALPSGLRENGRVSANGFRLRSHSYVSRAASDLIESKWLLHPSAVSSLEWRDGSKRIIVEVEGGKVKSKRAEGLSR